MLRENLINFLLGLFGSQDWSDSIVTRLQVRQAGIQVLAKPRDFLCFKMPISAMIPI